MNVGSNLSSPTQVQVEQWRQGNAEALGTLAVRFSPLVCARIQNSHSWVRLAHMFSVEDVEQEVWARVLRSGPEAFAPTDRRHAFAAWLGSLIDSTSIDLLRRTARDKRGGGKQPAALDSLVEFQRMRRPGQVSALSPSGAARLAEFEERTRATLNDRELKAWRWVVLESYTSAEAALGLDCTPAAVRSLLVRSRSKLQEALNPRDRDGGLADDAEG